MFVLPKSAERNLRTTIIPATPAEPGSGLNPAFHRGCTGKAHACGTIKTKLFKPTPPPRGEKRQRKNSISSENISDSGSEHHNSLLWNSFETNSYVNDDRTISSKKCTENALQTKKNCIETGSPLPSRKATKSFLSPILKRSSTSSYTRMRLHSEGEQNSECDSHSVTSSNFSAFERTQKYRSFRTKNKSNGLCKNYTVTAASIRPPWNSAAAGIKTSATSTNNSQTNLKGLRPSLRRRSESVSWQTIWERSLHIRSSPSSSINAGYFKNFDEIFNKKVCYRCFMLFN